MPDYLYISHPHDDHLDTRFLREHVSKDVVVILPDFPTDDHRRALTDLGFHNFLETTNGVPVAVDGLRILTNALVAPTDGAIGDSGLAVADGTATVFNQNDSKPIDLSALEEFGPYDLHLAQFSGAIWYPMIYRLSAEEQQALGRRKRANQLARAARFVKEIGASRFVPFAGPPCFLDDDLFHLNDVDDDDSNIFVDQRGALAYMQANGNDRGLLAVPGTVIELDGGACDVTHPGPDAEIERPFSDKERYLREYQSRMLPRIRAEMAALPDHSIDIRAELNAWWEPLLEHADHTCAGVNDRVLLKTEDVAIVVDFLERRVDTWNGESCGFRFFVARPILEECIVRRDVDWVNSLFLSCRLEAERDGPYNEFVYNFFRSLSTERMAYTERYYSEVPPPLEVFEAEGYEIQRRCPHLKADLTRFGSIEDGILTCSVHGWKFELESGRCLTSDDRHLYCRAIDELAAQA